MKPTRLYGIPNCDTVKKARAWLVAQGVEHEFVDFKKAGTSAGQLQRWCDGLGWERVLNRQGTTWRKLDGATQAAVVDAASACALMQRQTSVIKRPIVEWADGALTVGFSAPDWEARVRR